MGVDCTLMAARNVLERNAASSERTAADEEDRCGWAEDGTGDLETRKKRPQNCLP
jgi:hypothetical protein